MRTEFESVVRSFKVVVPTEVDNAPELKALEVAAVACEKKYEEAMELGTLTDLSELAN